MARTGRAAVNAAAVDDARAIALRTFLDTQEKARPGEVLLLNGDGAPRVDIDVIPTGAISLDLAIGAGGFPRGRIIELYGPESGGKTTLALEVAKRCQDEGGNVGFVDAEHALNRELCQHIGIDEARFVISQPDSGEKAIDIVSEMIRSGAFDIVIVDSVAAMVPEAELDAETTQQFMGLHARLMSKFMRRVAGDVSNTGTMLVLINQVRKDLGAYGAPDTTTGGRAIRFYASLRIEVRTSSSKKIERNGQVVGVTVKATVKKNKVGPPFRQAEYDVIFGQGIEGSGALLDVAEATGVIERRGASYTYVTTGERIAIGKDNAKQLLSSEEGTDLRSRITDEVYAAMRGRTPESESALEGADVEVPAAPEPSGDNDGEVGEEVGEGSGDRSEESESIEDLMAVG